VIHRIFFSAVAAVSFSGCASTFKGRPERNTRPKEILLQLHSSEQSNVVKLIEIYHSSGNTPNRMKSIRNQIIDISMIEIDQNFILFVSDFTTSKKSFDTITELGSILADSASAAFTPASTKTVLSLVSGGLTASRTSVGKNFFYEQSLKALLQQMSAERRSVARDLIKGTGATVDQYPLAAALQDIERYYFAGTIDGAFVGVQKDAAQKEEKANQDIAEIRKISSYAELSKAWIANNGAGAARTKIRAWLNTKDGLHQVLAQAVVVTAAVDSGLEIERIAALLPESEQEKAKTLLKEDRTNKTANFLATYGSRLNTADVVGILPGDALSYVAGSAAEDDPLGINKTSNK